MINGDIRIAEYTCRDCGKPLREIYIEFTNSWYGCMCECEKIAEEEFRKRQKAMHDEARKRNAAIPDIFKYASLDNYLPDAGSAKTLARCKKYVDTFELQKSNGVGMVLSGCTGSGKSHLAAAISWAVLGLEISVRYWNVDDLLKTIRGTYNGASESEWDILEPCYECGLLVLDDLGAEKSGGDWHDAIIYGIIDNRYRKKKPTIITTNLTEEELERTVDARAYSRIMDKNHYRLLPIGSSDYRRRI